MGDRCSVTVTIHKDDLSKFIEIVGKASGEFEVGAHAGLDYDEANYALADELDDAAKAGLRFLAYHGNGDEYNHGAHVSYAGEAVYVTTCGYGEPVVTVPVYPASLAEAEKFLDLRARFLGGRE